MATKKKARHYIRIDGLTAWEALAVLCQAKPGTQIVTCQTDACGVITLIEVEGGPWVRDELGNTAWIDPERVGR